MVLEDFTEGLKTGRMPPVRPIVKKGTLRIGAVETTPVVWNGRLLRFEWMRPAPWGAFDGTPRPVGRYHFVDMATGAETPPFANDHAFGCCWAENGVMYVHGVRGGGGGNVLDCFTSRDLIRWEQRDPFVFPESYSLFNTSVARGPDGYVMAVEAGSGAGVGARFTNFFAVSDDLLHWALLPTDRFSYAPDRYTACPVIRFSRGWWYMIYLEGLPCHRWVPYIVRTRDFERYQLGLRNPVLWFSDEDKRLFRPEDFTPAQREEIRNAVVCNNSDVDLCEFEGRTVLLYSWGNQFGREYLALAEWDGGLDDFFASFFPEEA